MTKPCLPGLFTDPESTFTNQTFPGPDLQAEDHERLTTQLRRIYEVMRDGEWRTLPQIAELAGAPEASASAQLRHLRKPRFGGYDIERRYLGQGLYQYRMVMP